MAILQGNMSLTWWSISALTLMLIISFILIISIYRRMKRFESSYVSLQTFMSGKQLDILLHESNIQISNQEQKLDNCDKRIELVEQKLRAGADRVELLRFRAFEDIGSDLSFAMALLNQEGSGVVLSSIYNREDSRVYAKPVIEGQSTYPLTEEERDVIAKARRGHKV